MIGKRPRDLFKLLDNQYWIGFDCCATERIEDAWYFQMIS